MTLTEWQRDESRKVLRLKKTKDDNFLATVFIKCEVSGAELAEPQKILNRLFAGVYEEFSLQKEKLKKIEAAQSLSQWRRTLKEAGNG